MSDADDLEIFRSVLEGLQLGVYIVDRDRKVLFWNEGAEKITGYLRQDVIGRCCRDDILAHCDNKGTVLCDASACPLTDAMREGKFRQSDLFVHHKRGHRVPVRAYHMPVRNSRGVIVGAAESFQEQTTFSPERRKDMEAHGFLDSTTGVGNRNFIEFQLRASLAGLLQSHIPFGVLMVQIDQLAGFKATRGPSAESEITNVVATSLQNAIRDSDFVGRWTEGRFLIILSKCQPNAVAMVAERIKKVASCSGIEWWGDRLSVTVSVGSAIAEAGDTLERLLQRAEKSLSEAARSADKNPG